MKTDEEKIKEILSRNIEQVITKEELEKKLHSGRQLRIKHGVDATSASLHLGHAVNYRKMREFQEMGHKVVFLIGDFTTQIGDPTGKSKTRPELSQKEIKNNIKTYLQQAVKILINKPKVLEVRRNSEWYKKMKLNEFLGLLRKITHARLIERDMFQKRIKSNEEIYEHEIMYPILQGYDSVMLKSDLTIIGTDQLFNEMIGRHYQQIFGQEQQAIITTTITPGLDGKEKMSKSLNNFVGIADSPENKFGKIMTLPDDLIGNYLLVHTDLTRAEVEEIKKEKPFAAKKRLAGEIVKIYDGAVAAAKARDNFEKIFSRRETPADVKVSKINAGKKWGDFLMEEKLVRSKAEAKRMIGGGGVDFDGIRISNFGEKITKGGVAKIGKYKFVKIEILKA
ncbi:tyrosine--tRNA ligase [Candidatus Giovannonibacteria bacterium RIFCSPHIGHO2_02_43_13]|uniref:Tyrosine--tRNA ligase n=1 Tax=Candidatus Giovannonibacteria bacterium RIFCSPHIGHO2_02_43_13 TaxID=1798330 RepID=A0A1F5WU16_9BACT|nr:MAG: Tyrosyl-tRNA synthetase [Parcubacteria group bacterium GW2011_GWA2_44_13]OGF73091.1 MAG: tyrosine--tRNA ligase [Candidatus Giovannonibacteria bacterium RIFCSPHIGHO2_12_FULL_44_42]OGF79132.1 MAG: tyrosine--tRNA ligase [Candidatus Giovannonibacteria bacterium RIFCSPHIGHO2_02_43_13]OGF88936.1 MAG: tyrosine--tRNA ligase [Candidatus Giovannonibacteria bacterium RIFCSPLOWO2_02_FULL_43_54]OGF97277.1 MAG: tyrosine--tRNA ligase [Candidatus Giovannonibacteria bacterium RIFCSPLOWO2_12_FULL_44_32]